MSWLLDTCTIVVYMSMFVNQEKSTCIHRYKDYHSIKSLHCKLRHVHVSECVHKAFPKHETKG